MKQRLIDESRSRGIYLQPGDEVVAQARWLGGITTTVAAPDRAFAVQTCRERGSAAPRHAQ